MLIAKKPYFWPGLLLSVLLPGCATPDYLLPGGYSSTYHHAMENTFQQQQLMYDHPAASNQVYRLPAR